MTISIDRDLQVLVIIFIKCNVSAHDMRAKYQVKKSLSKIAADTNSDEI